MEAVGGHQYQNFGLPPVERAHFLSLVEIPEFELILCIKFSFTWTQSQVSNHFQKAIICIYVQWDAHKCYTHTHIYNMCILYNIVTKTCHYIQCTILYTSIYTIAQIYSVMVGSEKCHEFLVILPVASQHPLPWQHSKKSKTSFHSVDGNHQHDPCETGCQRYSKIEGIKK